MTTSTAFGTVKTSTGGCGGANICDGMAGLVYAVWKVSILETEAPDDNLLIAFDVPSQIILYRTTGRKTELGVELNNMGEYSCK